MALNDPTTTAAQMTPPSALTRVALLATLAVSFVTVAVSGLVPSSIAIGLFAIVCAAQFVGHPSVLGSVVNRYPTTLVALGVVVLAVYSTVQFGFVVGGILWCSALFVLCLDWNTLARLPLPLLLSVLLVTVAMTRGQFDGLLPFLVAWTFGVVATLVFIERDATRAGQRLRVREEPSDRRFGNAAFEIAAIAILLLILAPLLALFVPNNTGRISRTGDSFEGERQSEPYWGFQDRLDTAARGKLNDEVVMRVQADAPDYWRGTTFDRWDGRTWTKTPGRQRPSSGYGTIVTRLATGDERGGTPFRQVVTIERSGTDLIFGAYRAAEIDMAEPARVDSSDGTVRAFSELTAGSVYTVTSQRKDVTQELLRQHDPLSQPIPQEIADRYLDLPAKVPARVTQLAHDITASQATTYDKVQAIHAWMRDNTEYSLDIPPLPEGADAVEQHLFVDKKGFCEQIATSTTVMLRSVGIPARLATGYIPGERNPFTGEFTVRARDAHAWVEVWFPTVGWQAFDPTASVPLAGESSQSWWELVVRLLRTLLPYLAIILVAAVCYFLGRVVLRRLRANQVRRREPWTIRMTERLLRDGHRRGRSRQPHESLVEYARALADDELPDPRVVEAAKTISSGLFSTREPGEDRRRWVESVLDEVERTHSVRAVRTRHRDAARAARRAEADARRAARAAARRGADTRDATEVG